MKYAGVIVDISHEKLDKTFSYSIPAELENRVEVGSLVDITFNNTKRKGYVVEITGKKPENIEKIKPISGIVEKSVTANEKMIKLAYWMKTNYGSTINAALKTVISVKKEVRGDVEKNVVLMVSEKEAESLFVSWEKKKSARARILKLLALNGTMEYKELLKKANVSNATVKTLEDSGIIRIESKALYRNNLNIEDKITNPVELNSQQQAIADAIVTDYNNNNMQPCLIKGVTGSGKTQVYMAIIEQVIKSGREVIVLIPEIALTYQTMLRFYEKFGKMVSVVNSRLSKGEKYDRFTMAEQGKIKIMIGPRSALFTPFNNLGLIIIDEEHENAYQCETVPKYHARETAIQLAKMCNAKVVMGSATPSMESYYRAQKGEYRLYELNNRAGMAGMAEVEVVDLRDELKKGNRTMFSGRLRELIKDRLDKKQQAMLFLNRRGYLGFINCRDCGHVIQCPHCEVSLTQHNNRKLICHYCGYETDMVKICPECGKNHIGTFKAGTQKVEEEIKKIFPTARVLRMDLDTTRGKEGHRKILESFAAGEADILVGTQMIVKGHDFANVTLMGILLADASLHSPDYKAAEQTFDLLTQASGRAGRSEIPGNVIIQTYDPEHYAIKCAAHQNYESFYREEIMYRELMEYPPVSHMMSVKISSEDENMAVELSKLLKNIASEHEKYKVRVIGPANASVYKIKDVYYRVIYCKSPDYGRLTVIKDDMEKYMKENEINYKNCQIQFDFR